MAASLVELGLALLCIAAAGSLLIRLLDNYREIGRKGKS